MSRFKKIANAYRHRTALTFKISRPQSQKSPCPVCGSHIASSFLRVQNQSDVLEMVKCTCGSLYYPGKCASDYLVAEGRDSFYMRLDQAEGIDSIILPLFLNPAFTQSVVADIGCGLGFSADFLRYKGVKVLAFDPSPAASLSTELLEIDITNVYVDSTNIKLPENSLVFASEVVEHVENPQLFVEKIRTIAGDSGYAIFTTPLADYISSEAPKEQILSMIAPSQHLFLLSEEAFLSLARASGFKWARSLRYNDRLFVVCGPQPVSLNLDFDRSAYVGYLQNRRAIQTIDDGIRARSFGFRLFKEFINSGDYDEAKLILIDLHKSYLRFNLDLYDPLGVVESIKVVSQNGKNLVSFEEFPYNLGPLFTLIFTLHVAHHKDIESAVPYAKAVVELSRIYKKMFRKHDFFSSFDLEILSLEKNIALQTSLHNIKI